MNSTGLGFNQLLVTKDASNCINQSINQSISLSVGRSVRPSVRPSVRQPVSQSVSQAEGQKVSQKVRQSLTHSLTQSFNRPSPKTSKRKWIKHVLARRINETQEKVQLAEDKKIDEENMTCLKTIEQQIDPSCLCYSVKEYIPWDQYKSITFFVYRTWQRLPCSSKISNRLSGWQVASLPCRVEEVQLWINYSINQPALIKVLVTQCWIGHSELLMPT